MSSSKKPDSLMSIFDATIKRAPSKSTNKTPAIKPSMLGTACMRKLFYSFTKVDEDFAIPISNIRIMELGTAIGKMFANVYRKAGIIIDYRNIDGSFPKDFNGDEDREFPVVAAELELKKGKIDFVGILNGELWLGEFKSSNNFYFGNLVNAKYEHLIQGTVYLYVFNKMLREGYFSHIKELSGFTAAKGIRYLYLNKDSSAMKEFAITTADELFKQIVYKIEEVKSYAKNDILPPKTPDFCKSCSWRGKCENNLKK